MSNMQNRYTLCVRGKGVNLTTSRTVPVVRMHEFHNSHLPAEWIGYCASMVREAIDADILTPKVKAYILVRDSRGCVLDEIDVPLSNVEALVAAECESSNDLGDGSSIAWWQKEG